MRRGESLCCDNSVVMAREVLVAAWACNAVLSTNPLWVSQSFDDVVQMVADCGVVVH